MLETTRPLFSSYLRIRSLAPSPSSPELLQSRDELESALREITSDLQDLVESVRAIENDPSRFGLAAGEVARRRRLVEDVGREVEAMRAELAGAIAKTDGETGTTSGALPSPSTFDDDGTVDTARQDDYARFEQQRQLEIMHEQDDALDGVFQTVGNLRQQADEMGRELGEQGELLDDIDHVADRVSGRLQIGIRKVGGLIKRNEGERILVLWKSPLSLHLC